MKPIVLIVDDNEAILRLFRRHLSIEGYEVQTASTLAEAREAIAERRFDAVLLDLNLPDGSGLDWVSELRQSDPATAIVVITGHGDIPLVVEAMRRGADNFLAKPVDMTALTVFLNKGLEIGTMRRRQFSRRRTLKLLEPYFGEAPSMMQVLDLATSASRSDSTVLIWGETGVGKGVLARYIQEHSARATAPFVEVNCSSLRGEMLSSELFGHARGAFTSAVEDKQGLIEIADGGTLFLDEIGDMDINVQAQFLKVIEEKRFRRLGEVRIRTSEFRLICATNQNLEERVEEGLFRRDLFYRINVLPITIPPLRTVTENIPGLVTNLLRFITSRDVPVDKGVFDLFAKYPWPGNIRELRNVLERGLCISPDHLKPDHFRWLVDSQPRPRKESTRETLNLAETEAARIREAMTRFHGDVKKVCEALGISRATLYRRLAEMKKTEPASA